MYSMHDPPVHLCLYVHMKFSTVHTLTLFLPIMQYEGGVAPVPVVVLRGAGHLSRPHHRPVPGLAPIDLYGPGEGRGRAGK